MQIIDLNLDSLSVAGIAVRFRANQPGFLQFFIATGNGSEFSFQHVQDLGYPAGSEFQVYFVAFTQEVLVHSQLVLLRVDPAINEGTRFDIDWIGLISSGRVVPTPTPFPVKIEHWWVY